MAINENIRRSFWFNLLMVVLLCGALYMLFFASLRWITRHGEEIQIPNVTGKNMTEAITDLQKMDFDVYVDSIYDPKQKPFVVLNQIPEVGATVKRGRILFITVNRAVPPSIPMPNLIGLSYRSAEIMLKNNKLLLGDTSYKPDIAIGAILQQVYKGNEIRPGQMIPQGSKIDLVIGDGLGVTQFNVPDVIGMSVDEATTYLTGNGLQYTLIFDGDISDSSSAVIYDQIPKPVNEMGQPNRIKAGDVVDLRVKQNPTSDEMEVNRNGGGSNSGSNADMNTGGNQPSNIPPAPTPAGNINQSGNVNGTNNMNNNRPANNQNRPATNQNPRRQP